MMDEDEGFVLFVCFLGLIVAFFMGGLYFGANGYKQQAIEKGYAEYHSETGVWQWKD